jgi:hypothetical protein
MNYYKNNIELFDNMLNVHTIVNADGISVFKKKKATFNLAYKIVTNIKFCYKTK